MPGHRIIQNLLQLSERSYTQNGDGWEARSLTESINQKAYVLLAYIPGILSKRLYHKSLDKVLSPLRLQKADQPLMAIDSDGYRRHTWRVLMGWIVDMEEVWTILCLGHFVCPFYPSPDCCRRGAVSRRSNAEIGSLDDTWAFANAAKKVGLCGVEKPCWGWRVGPPWNVDIVKIISHDLLHWYHKAFREFTAPTPTTRFPPFHLDYVYLATYPYHTEESLAKAQRRVDDFEAARDVYARQNYMFLDTSRTPSGGRVHWMGQQRRLRKGCTSIW